MYNERDEKIERTGKHRVYQTAREGCAWGLRFVAGAAVLVGGLIFIVVKLFWLRPPNIPRANTLSELVVIFGGALVFILAILIPAIWHFRNASNSKVIISDTGLTVVNWRKTRDFTPWENIVSLVQRDYLKAGSTSGWLVVELQDSVGHHRRTKIARYYGRCPPAMDGLREEIVRRRRLSQVEKAPRSVLGSGIEWLSRVRQRVWR